MVLNAQTLSSADDARPMILLSIEDITERKSAENAMARLAAIVECSDDAIIAKDLAGIIKTWNRGAEQLFGYTQEEAIGQPITLLIPPDRIDEEAVILDRIHRGSTLATTKPFAGAKMGDCWTSP